MRPDRPGSNTQDPVVPRDWLEGEVAVLGLGKTGAAVVRALHRVGIRVYASDVGEGPRLRNMAAEFRSMGADVDLGKHDLSRIASSTAVVVSPGIPPEAEAVVAAAQAGLEIWSEIDLALLSLGDSRIVGVTGTNGKTTTTTLIDHVLATCGARSVAAGNIGLPLIDVAQLAPRPDWVVVEFSSFQLHYSRRLDLFAGVITNIQPDHLDWYKNETAYFEDKKRLFLNQKPESHWIVNGDDARTRQIGEAVVGRVKYWSLEHGADAWFDRERKQLILEGHAILSRTAFPLLGDHNVSNALAAALAVRAGGFPLTEIGTGLRNAPQLEHRLERVPSVDGIRWINDSKATNVSSAMAALRSLEGNVILLAGGLDKGEDLTPLAEMVRRRCSHVFLFGASAEKFTHAFRPASVERTESLAEAVRAARSVSRMGDTVLLSPACASFDQFENYIARGNTFRELVNGT